MQIAKSPFTKSLDKIPVLFITSMHHVGSENIFLGYYYKPLFFISYNVIHNIGNGTPCTYHLTQVLLHCLNAALLWLIFKRFFSTPLSYCLALLFLVHPIQEETVVYIANMQDVLFFTFGAFSLLVMQTAKTQKSILAACVLLFLAALSKDTGVLFIIIVGIYISLFKPQWRQFYIISACCLAIIYGLLRIISSQSYFLQILIQHPPLIQRLPLIPTLFSTYMQELFFPTTTITFPRPFFVPHISATQHVVSSLILLICLSIYGYLWHWTRTNYKKQFSIFLFFSFWFLFSLGMHLQIFSLDQFIAKRWMYLPLAGLLGLVGTLAHYIIKKKRNYVVFIYSVLALLILYFSYQTHIMNTFWTSEYELSKHAFPVVK